MCISQLKNQVFLSNVDCIGQTYICSLIVKLSPLNGEWRSQRDLSQPQTSCCYIDNLKYSIRSLFVVIVDFFIYV
jgi:hypothetical protein